MTKGRGCSRDNTRFRHAHLVCNLRRLDVSSRDCYASGKTHGPNLAFACYLMNKTGFFA
jgi:hypothetical protein